MYLRFSSNVLAFQVKRTYVLDRTHLRLKHKSLRM